MKNYTFIVSFGDDWVTVYAGSQKYAIILAQAERIKSGLHINVAYCAQVEE